MTEKKFLEKEEIETLKKLNEKFQNLREQIGEIEIQLITLNEKKKKLKDELISFQDDEIKLAKELELKYGEGQISLKDGEFTPVSN